MVLGKRHAIKSLNDKECFEKWCELGSVERVSKYLENSGKINRRTNKPFTPMSVWHAAMRYALENLDEVFGKFKEIGGFNTREEWEEYMVEKAMTVYYSSKKRYMDWIRRNNFEKYSYIYSMRFSDGK